MNWESLRGGKNKFSHKKGGSKSTIEGEIKEQASLNTFAFLSLFLSILFMLNTLF